MSASVSEHNPLRAARVSKNMRQADAAVACGVSRATWAAWEARTRPITTEQLRQIAAAFGVDATGVLAIVEWSGRPLLRRPNSR